MKIGLLVLTAFALIGCKSAKVKHFENVAAHANPVILELRPHAAIVLSASSDTKVVRTACEKAIATMSRLKVKFWDAEDADPGRDADAAIASLGMASAYCAPDTGNGEADERCAAWCRQTVKWFAGGLQSVHDGAAKEHVQIETLTP